MFRACGLALLLVASIGNTAYASDANAPVADAHSKPRKSAQANAGAEYRAAGQFAASARDVVSDYVAAENKIHDSTSVLKAKTDYIKFIIWILLFFINAKNITIIIQI